jgi:hypothetical protein
MDRIDAGHDDDVGGERLRAGQATPGAKAETLKAEMLKAEDGSGEKQKVESRKQKSEGGGANIERPTSNIQHRTVPGEVGEDFAGREEILLEGGGSRVVQAAVRGMLNKLVESAPAAAGAGRAPAVAWAGLRLAAMVLLAAGVGIGLGDGDEFDDVGCSTAQKPEGGKAEMLKPEVEEPNLSLAAKVFELLTALDPGSRLRKAPPIKVFNLYYRQCMGAAEIARKCNCDRSLIYDRLAAIQRKVRWPPEQLREVSPHVEAMQDAVRDSRARRIYRKGAASGDEDDGGE